MYTDTIIYTICRQYNRGNGIEVTEQRDQSKRNSCYTVTAIADCSSSVRSVIHVIEQKQHGKDNRTDILKYLS